MNFLDFASYDWDTWMTFLQENWFVLAIGLIVLILVIRIVKTVVKWALVAAVVIGLVVYSGYTLDDVKEIGTKVMASVKDEAINAMVGEAKEAKYTLNDDGTYTITTKNIDLKGKVGDSEVKVSLHNAPYVTLELEGAIKQFIDQAKQNG
ncbi:hypothetical protein I6N90_15435 [Paenibacillus sp. GSMTC-2017]|uniref:hypothetical protein n=1 Tax=Paenibacillus sp. GSMTC-2017 TaxID=2794350 RepID=UPI0018D6F5B7|nr:hypothetical protein [Paenibacillus sp. GSMTC-2017]MBH5319195.1 hypothetical protein [Paenibacillus sp. GSMTC-2017]